VNRKSRKPFYWGGLKGYEQLEAIGQALEEVPSDGPETRYLRRLKMRVDRVVEAYQVNAADLSAAHTWLRGIADCLRYPPSDSTPEPSLTGEQVKQEMEALLQSFQPDLKRRPAQAALHGAWHRTWEEYGPDLLPCYDIPGLPPDNLMLESLLGGCVAISVASVAGNPPVNCETLGSTRFCFWLRASKICWNRSVKCPWKRIARTDGVWRRPKLRAAYSTVYIAIRLGRCVVWSISTLSVELPLRRPPVIFH
jgi:hypothetical protein